MEVKLACGADMNRVWEGATQPLTEHEAECPACQAVRIEALRADQLRDDTVAEDAQTKVVVDPLKLSSVWRSYAADLSPRHCVFDDVAITAVAMSLSVAPWKGLGPVSSSYSTTPSENTSHRRSTGSWRTCSGAM